MQVAICVVAGARLDIGAVALIVHRAGVLEVFVGSVQDQAILFGLIVEKGMTRHHLGVFGRHLVTGRFRDGDPGVGCSWRRVGEPSEVDDLPVEKRLICRIGGQDALELGGSGARHAGDHDRVADILFQDLGVALQVLGHPQAIHELIHDPVRESRGSGCREREIAGRAGEILAERLYEARVSVVVELGGRARPLHQDVGIEAAFGFVHHGRGSPLIS